MTPQRRRLIESILYGVTGNDALTLALTILVLASTVEIEYKGLLFFESLTLDLYVDDCLLVELKSVQTVLPIHKAQLLSYMRLMQAPLGLLLNFHEPSLRDGICRMILPGTVAAVRPESR